MSCRTAAAGSGQCVRACEMCIRDSNYSWYKLGGFTLQPTELAKISFILTFAMHLNNCLLYTSRCV